MPARPFRRPLFAAVFAAALLASACGSGGIDGKYYNSASGEFAMELKGGRVITMQGQEGRALTYAVKGDSLVISGQGMADGMTFHIEKDGTLSLGILGSLTKKRP